MSPANEYGTPHPCLPGAPGGRLAVAGAEDNESPGNSDRRGVRRGLAGGRRGADDGRGEVVYHDRRGRAPADANYPDEMDLEEGRRLYLPVLRPGRRPREAPLLGGDDPGQ